MTTVLDGAGEGSAKASWVLMRRSKKRTCLGPQAPGQNLRGFRQLNFVDRKSRTGIGPHPPAPGRAESPVILVVEAGYVRTSEVINLPLSSMVRNERQRFRPVAS